MAPLITLARDATAERINRLDGWTSGGSSDPHVTASRPASSTERHGEQRARLAADYQQLHEDLGQIDELVRSVIGMCQRMVTGKDITQPELPDVPLCMEGQTGKDGSIEWGDTTCAMPAVKSGMCQAHYLAWYRHRRSRGIDVSRDHEPTAA